MTNSVPRLLSLARNWKLVRWLPQMPRWIKSHPRHTLWLSHVDPEAAHVTHSRTQQAYPQIPFAHRIYQHQRRLGPQSNSSNFDAQASHNKLIVNNVDSIEKTLTMDTSTLIFTCPSLTILFSIHHLSIESANDQPWDSTHSKRHTLFVFFISSINQLQRLCFFLNQTHSSTC